MIYWNSRNHSDCWRLAAFNGNRPEWPPICVGMEQGTLSLSLRLQFNTPHRQLLNDELAWSFGNRIVETFVDQYQHLREWAQRIGCNQFLVVCTDRTLTRSFTCLQFGQVGCGNTTDQNIPQLVSGLSHEVCLSCTSLTFSFILKYLTHYTTESCPFTFEHHGRLCLTENALGSILGPLYSRN